MMSASCLAQAKFWLQKAPVPHSHFGIQWRSIYLLNLYIVESIKLLLQEPIWIFDLFGVLYEVVELSMLYFDAK